MGQHTMPKLHNAMWPGLVGKGDGEGQEPPISLEKMLDLTAAANVGGQKFEGIDYFLFLPHTDPNASDDEIRRIADMIQSKGFTVGSLVAPVWPGTVGDSAMGDQAAREKFLDAVRVACRIAKIFNQHGVRKYGVIRIDSAEFGVSKWREDAKANTKKIAETFRQAAKIAADNGERLAAEGEICWAGMHSWRRMIQLLELADRPGTLGFQADMAHTLLYTLGYNAPEDRIVPENFQWDAATLDKSLATLTAALRPWTIDFHIAQNDATVKGSGSHDKTGRHCLPDDPNGKLKIAHHAGFWMRDSYGNLTKKFKHVCWDGCMFPNETMKKPETWNKILAVMIAVRDAHGWN